MDITSYFKLGDGRKWLAREQLVHIAETDF